MQRSDANCQAVRTVLVAATLSNFFLEILLKNFYGRQNHYDSQSRIVCNVFLLLMACGVWFPFHFPNFSWMKIERMTPYWTLVSNKRKVLLFKISES